MNRALLHISTPLTITVSTALVLRGGNVTIEGPATLVTRSGVTPKPNGFQITSSGNRLHALTLEGFDSGVEIRPVSPPLPVGVTYTDNTVERLTIRSARHGVVLSPSYLECDPCATHNAWVNTTITDNVIEASQSGVHVTLTSVGDLVDGITITGNTLRIGTAAEPDAGGDGAIIIAAGLQRARASVIEDA